MCCLFIDSITSKLCSGGIQTARCVHRLRHRQIVQKHTYHSVSCVLRCVHRLSQPNCPKVHIAFCVQVGAKLQGVFTDCIRAKLSKSTHSILFLCVKMCSQTVTARLSKSTQHSVSVFRWEPSCKVCSQTTSQALCASSAEQHSPTCDRATSWNGSTSASRSG